MEDIKRAVEFLKYLGRNDLAELLKYSTYELTTVEVWHDIEVSAVRLYAPPVFAEALSGLSDADQKRIAEAVASDGRTFKDAPERLLVETSDNEQLSDTDRILPEVINQKNVMIQVATGERRIDDVNDYYRARRRRIASALSSLGIEDPNPHADLWDWYQKWKADFPTYAERRNYVNSMYNPIIDRLLEAPLPPVPEREPTGWDRVDRAIEKARTRLITAEDEEDFQEVGLLCREIIISLAQAVYDPEEHSSPDGVEPSRTDAKRMISAFLLDSAPGGTNEELRRHVRSSLSLAVSLQHRRTASFRDAALCVEATSSVVNIIAILAGRRDPIA